MTKIIFWLITCFVSTFGFIYFYYKLGSNNSKISLKTIIIFLIGFILSTILELLNLNIVTTFLFFIYFPILFKSIRSLPLKKIFCFLLIIWLYGMVFDYICMLCISILHFFININVDSEIMVIIPTVFVFISLFIIGNVNVLNKLTLKLIEAINNIKYSDFALVSFATFILVIAIAVALNVENLSINVLLMLVIFFVIIILILLIKLKIGIRENRIFVETLKSNNEYYSNMEDEFRIFKHNLTAKLLSIKSVSNKKAKILIDDLIKQYKKNLKFTNNLKVIPYGIDGVISQKLYLYYDEINLKVVNSITYDIFSVLRPRRYNVMVEKLVIVLDNAIEATLKSKEKILMISIFEEKNGIIIEVKNSFNEEVNVDMLGNKNYSTKGKKHGLGLFSALRNSEVGLSVKIHNNLFISRIVAKKRLFD